MSARRLGFLCVSLLLAGGGERSALASTGEVLSHQKISDSQGGFTGTLGLTDYFGASVAPLGDLDGDGVVELAVGVERSFESGGVGAVWILFLNADGTVKSHQKISGGGAFEHFGISVAPLGDLDGDGVNDLAVGADIDFGTGRTGAVWILFLNADGTVASHQEINSVEGNFTGPLEVGDKFGSSVASLGDLNGDGTVDLAVGAKGDDDGGNNRGAVWLLFLNPDGTVRSHQKISDTEGDFTGVLANSAGFGQAAAALGDFDGDDVVDLAVGSTSTVWMLFLNGDGTVKSHRKIGGFLLNGSFVSISLLGDLDGDGVGDLAVGAPLTDDGGERRGAVWILFLEPDGTLKESRRISGTAGNFEGKLDDGDRFGTSVANVGDLDGSGVVDLAVGAARDDDGGVNHGAVWMLFLDGCGNGNLEGGERCDDGNDVDGDGCDSNCTATGCGNGIATAGEQCDDGNTEGCDGCLADCTVTVSCGDGTVDPTCGELCDDGNTADGDGCDSNCTSTGCGNGILTPGEQCDDGNTADGDGCEADCTLSPFTVLVDQTDHAGGNGATDQLFEWDFDPGGIYASEGADDFVVTSMQGWEILRVETIGSSSVGSSNYVNIRFYPDDNGLPADTPVCEYDEIITYFDVGGDLTIVLPTPCNLGPGTYWMAQHVQQDYLTDGQHFWSSRVKQDHSEGVWRNPGNEFATGCLDWMPQSSCPGTGLDFLFRLIGTEGEGDGVPAVGPYGLLLIVVALGGGCGYVLARRRHAASDPGTHG